MTAVLLWTGVMACGGVGAVARLVIDGAITQRLQRGLPHGTLAINLSGAFVLGLLDGWVLPTDLALLVGTGLIGAYTTFSTWMYETHRLIEGRQHRDALANIVVSSALGVLGAALGLWIGGLL